MVGRGIWRGSQTCGGTCSGVPTIRIIALWGLHLGLLFGETTISSAHFLGTWTLWEFKFRSQVLWMRFGAAYQLRSSNSPPLMPFVNSLPKARGPLGFCSTTAFWCSPMFRGLNPKPCQVLRGKASTITLITRIRF